MAKGGARAGAGRKKNPAKELAPVGEQTAQEFLDSLGKHPPSAKIFLADEPHKGGHVEEMRRLYYEAKRTGHYWVAVSVIMKNREWAYGKPVQTLQVANKPGEKLNVNVTSEREKLIAALSR